MSNHFSFNIEHWHALSSGLSNQQDWQQWAQHRTWPKEFTTPAADLIPAMMRRRMSTLSKLALQTAMSLHQQLLEQEKTIDYLIFSSRHGELNRTIDLLQEILRGEDASPTAFSQSVHNTSSGLFTIAAKQAIPATSIAAGEATLHCALIEAAAYLKENPNHRILLVDFDEPLPKPYDIYQPENTSEFGFALGLVLSTGKTYQLAWSGNTAQPARHQTEDKLIDVPQTLDIIAHLASQDSQWVIKDSHMQWSWSNNAAK